MKIFVSHFLIRAAKVKSIICYIWFFLRYFNFWIKNVNIFILWFCDFEMLQSNESEEHKVQFFMAFKLSWCFQGSCALKKTVKFDTH